MTQSSHNFAHLSWHVQNCDLIGSLYYRATNVFKKFINSLWNGYIMMPRGHFYYIKFNPTWISNHMSSKVRDEIIYPFPNINGCTAEVWKWEVMKSLTHWGRVTHICVSNLTTIGSGNGLSPGRRQAITRTNAGILLIGPLGTNFGEILVEIPTFSFKKMHLKVSSAKWRPFCLGLNVLALSRQQAITWSNKQRVLMHGHQGWNVRHGLCHIYMIYVYIWVVYSFCLFCCLFIIVTTQFVALYKPCKPKPKPSTYA